MDKLIFVTIMVIGGSSVGMQSIVNANLTKRTGPYITGALCGMTVMLTFTLLATCTKNGNLSAITSVPKWQLLGGLFGAISLFCFILCTPRVGSYGAAVCSALRQMGVTVIVDHFGWFGMTVNKIDSWRIVGLILILCGVICVFKRNFFPAL